MNQEPQVFMGAGNGDGAAIPTGGAPMFGAPQMGNNIFAPSQTARRKKKRRKEDYNNLNSSVWWSPSDAADASDTGQYIAIHPLNSKAHSAKHPISLDSVIKKRPFNIKREKLYTEVIPTATGLDVVYLNYVDFAPQRGAQVMRYPVRVSGKLQDVASLFTYYAETRVPGEISLGTVAGTAMISEFTESGGSEAMARDMARILLLAFILTHGYGFFTLYNAPDASAEQRINVILGEMDRRDATYVAIPDYGTARQISEKRIPKTSVLYNSSTMYAYLKSLKDGTLENTVEILRYMNWTIAQRFPVTLDQEMSEEMEKLETAKENKDAKIENFKRDKLDVYVKAASHISEFDVTVNGQRYDVLAPLPGLSDKKRTFPEVLNDLLQVDDGSYVVITKIERGDIRVRSLKVGETKIEAPKALAAVDFPLVMGGQAFEIVNRVFTRDADAVEPALKQLGLKSETIAPIAAVVRIRLNNIKAERDARKEGKVRGPIDIHGSSLGLQYSRRPVATPVGFGAATPAPGFGAM